MTGGRIPNPAPSEIGAVFLGAQTTRLFWITGQALRPRSMKHLLRLFAVWIQSPGAIWQSLSICRLPFNSGLSRGPKGREEQWIGSVKHEVTGGWYVAARCAGTPGKCAALDRATMARGHRCSGLAAVLGIPAGPDRCTRRDRRPHGRCDCAPGLSRANPSRGVGQSPLLVHHLALGSYRCLAVRDRGGSEACCFGLTPGFLCYLFENSAGSLAVWVPLERGLRKVTAVMWSRTQ